MSRFSQAFPIPYKKPIVEASDLNTNVQSLVDDLNTLAEEAVTTAAALQAAIDAVDTDLVNDTTPELGGNLDLNGKTVGDATAADLALLHGGTLLENVAEDTTPELGGDLDAQNKDILDVCTVSFSGEIDNGNSGTSKTIDLSAGMKQKIKLSGDCSVTFANPRIGHYAFRIIQSNTGSNTISFDFPTPTLWSGGIKYVPTSDPCATDIVSIYYDGAHFFGSVVGLDFSVPT